MPNPSSDRAIAIVGVGAILPDALNAPAFWQNIVNKRYCISGDASRPLEHRRLL